MDNKTLFERKTVPVAPKPVKKTTVSIKTRNGRKKDVKPLFLPEDKKRLQLRAMDKGVTLTELCSSVVKNYLNKEFTYNEYDYPFEGKSIHVLLEDDYFKKVELLHVEWDVPRRQVVHRIIKEYLEREAEGFEIVSYWGG